MSILVIVIDTLQADDQLQWDIYPEDGPAGAQNPTVNITTLSLFSPSLHKTDDCHVIH